MFNLHTEILNNPGFFKQMASRETMITFYDCPLKNKFEELWSEHSYIAYVTEGRKVWHTSQGSFDLHKGDCVLIRKGACIVEQFFDTKFCLIFFFVPDKFICDVLKSKSRPLPNVNKNYHAVISIDTNDAVHNFFNSMLTYFSSNREPDTTLLDLKFRELILTIADNPLNTELISYFCDLVKKPKTFSLQRVMEENYCFNLKLEGFASLCARSLSSFKRDFQNIYKTTPAKWLLEKRLMHAYNLIVNSGKTVAEASYESGFENISHFSNAFRKRFGAAPASLKQQSAV